MKTIIIIAACLLAACGEITPGSPNPLDIPETNYVAPEAIGYFGPHTEFYFHQ